MPQPVLIGSEIFRRSRHARGHPLAIPRVALTIDLCHTLGWLAPDAYVEAEPASTDDLTRFHDAKYVAAVREAERAQDVSMEVSRRFNLGINGNPIYGEVFQRPAMACGASLMAARILLERTVVYNPCGGTHHGFPDHASGYCIFNDPVLAILELQRLGVPRIFYLDLDAHFGDGVQAAFHDDGSVYTLSIHEAGRWPMMRGVAADDTPGGRKDRAGGAACNLPVPPGFNDRELAYLLEAVVLPRLVAFQPGAVVIQAGCDALADDPMTKLDLSNRALWHAVARVKSQASRLLVLGGGGYNPYAVARAWAGLWGVLNNYAIPERLPSAARTHLARVRWSHRLGRQPASRWLETLADEPNNTPIREEVRCLAAQKGRLDEN